MDINNYTINTASVACWYLALKHKLELSSSGAHMYTMQTYTPEDVL